jgi:UDPglucose--hexose-1-phosphate uridylyltransferase
MPELRQNFATKDWVIISTERAKRPSHYAEPGNRLLTRDRPEFDETCPFCPGNEELDLEVECHPDSNNWQTRVVRNKFPALAGDGLPIHTIDGVQHSMAGVGYHDVLVIHPKHNTTLALMQPPEIQQMLEAFQRRGRTIAQDPRIQQVIFFKNHGNRAGASLAHPHCQIIGMPVVPDGIRRRMFAIQRHFEENGENPICRMLEDELEREERLVVVSEHFVAFVLYAALSPFHMWIVPRKHRACFLQVPQEELADLGHVLREVMRRIYVGLNDPDFNMVIRSAPVKEQNNPHLHWYITIVLRLSFMAGFEMGSGMHINPSLPEACAEFLRDVDLAQFAEEKMQPR